MGILSKRMRRTLDRECPSLAAFYFIELYFTLGGMKTIPVQFIDPNVEVLSIRGPKNNIAIGPIFGQLKKLEVLRIVDSNVPSVGTHSFWGIKNLKVLGKSEIIYINNIACFMKVEKLYIHSIYSSDFND